MDFQTERFPKVKLPQRKQTPKTCCFHTAVKTNHMLINFNKKLSLDFNKIENRVHCNYAKV